ncbi:MAG: cupredoxin domain-containing protein [Georgfuchsia sp.]
MKILFLLILLAASFISCAMASVADVAITIKDHRFEPPEVKVAAGQKIKLIVHNQDATAEEFESYKLNREKMIPGGTKATIHIGPLSPGRYPFVGEFNEKTAQGAVIAE